MHCAKPCMVGIDHKIVGWGEELIPTNIQKKFIENGFLPFF